MNVPTYTISTKIIDLVARIAEKLGEIRGSGEYSRNLHLRKINRLRSIQSSLAIENNTLSLGQVTDIIEGKRVLGMPHEIQEVKNSYQVYEHLLEYDPYKVEDFLKAHKFMTSDLVKDAGHFRSQGVGVFSGAQLIHAGANYQFVPQLITDLFAWAKKTDVHPLIKSSIVHFETEFIHPFMDGNGRIGRLWQTLILSNGTNFSRGCLLKQQCMKINKVIMMPYKWRKKQPTRKFLLNLCSMLSCKRWRNCQSEKLPIYLPIYLPINSQKPNWSF